ncbi:hypothetical protein AVEN_198401-1 [Araneus ventricosus]|uniref:Uncharacterized protein n=1 Tax=Araneus ventricosus TaxID=182803 RepID=A0A4Y2SY25_ARAVE|nr:hypothetical protein AVEN_90591-1 [Araneus ventricosus]GBN93292.1 hypothetical protein AVEN_198401-1 [Araneus ventricosus]
MTEQHFRRYHPKRTEHRKSSSFMASSAAVQLHLRFRVVPEEFREGSSFGEDWNVYLENKTRPFRCTFLVVQYALSSVQCGCGTTKLFPGLLVPHLHQISSVELICMYLNLPLDNLTL